MVNRKRGTHVLHQSLFKKKQKKETSAPLEKIARSILLLLLEQVYNAICVFMQRLHLNAQGV